VSNTAYIRDITSLEVLRIGIARFCEESENQVQTIDSMLQSRISNLKSLESQFLRLIESAQDDLRNANHALSCCEANTYEDEEGNTKYLNCDSEQEELIDCMKRLQIAEHNYNSFRGEIRNVEMAIAEYQSPKVRYRTLIQFEKEAATSSLKQLINGAENYISVSSPLNNGLVNGLGLTEAVTKVDSTMILAATGSVAEIIFMNVFAFFGIGGTLFNLSNKKKNGLITTTYIDNGSEHTCSELKIENKDSENYGKIVSVNIPPSLQNEKVGMHLIQNMEANCRANDCKEIYGWANEANTPFYKGLGYETRNKVKESGSEVFKPINSSFSSIQKNAKDSFKNLSNSDFIGANNIGRKEINPLNVISPDEINDEKFWSQHGLDQAKYIDLIDKYQICQDELKMGKSLDEIRKEDMWVANAHDVFYGSEPIRLLKSGDYYQIDSNGRHRIAAAHMYYLQTEKIVDLPADIFEKNSK
jgi:N-acetylglutamate synthase-like GNAT family acetyltransferase